MKPEWIPLFLILGFMLFQLILKLSYPVWVLLHELGHAIPAILSKKANVRIEIGEGPEWISVPLRSLNVTIHRHQLSHGSTTYDGAPKSWAEACSIILPAPILSLLITIGFGSIIYQVAPEIHFVTLLILTAAWLANFHITFSVWWPLANPRCDVNDLIKQLRTR